MPTAHSGSSQSTPQPQWSARKTHVIHRKLLYLRLQFITRKAYRLKSAKVRNAKGMVWGGSRHRVAIAHPLWSQDSYRDLPTQRPASTYDNVLGILPTREATLSLRCPKFLLEFLSVAWLIDCSHDGPSLWLTSAPGTQIPTLNHVDCLSGIGIPHGQVWPAPPQAETILSGMTLPPRMDITSQKPGQSPDNSVGKTTVYCAIRTHIKLSQKTLSYQKVKLSKTTVIMSERLGTKLNGLPLIESSKK